MAARMSRAFAFSPLAMVKGVAGEECSGREPGSSEGLTASFDVGGLATAGAAVSSGAGGSPAAGFVDAKSNRVGWFRDAFTRAICDRG
jgi:hypothetical protein